MSLTDIANFGKCVVANKVALAGYSVLLSIPTLKTLSLFAPEIATPFLDEGLKLANDLVPYAKGSLMVTLFGYDTFCSFNRTAAHISRYGRVDRRFNDVMKRTHYCNQAGHYLAMREAGIEGTLQ